MPEITRLRALAPIALGLLGAGCGEAVTPSNLTTSVLRTSSAVIDPRAPDEAPATPSKAAEPPKPKAESRPTAPEPSKVTLEPIKYDALRARIAANKTAKLTLVDAWATWCPPCKENFPHVVEMNAKYAARGLSVISLSLDDPMIAKDIADARAFLVEKKANFTNFVLDEPQEAAFEKLDIGGVPAVFLFGPGGKEVKRFTLEDVDHPVSYAEVEAAVVAFLDGKPIPAGAAKKDGK